MKKAHAKHIPKYYEIVSTKHAYASTHKHTHTVRTYTPTHHCMDVVKQIYAYTSDSRAATVTSALQQGQRVHHFDLQPEPSSKPNLEHCTYNDTQLEVCI